MLSTLVGGSAIVAGLVGCWNYIKLYLSKIYSLFFVRLKIDEDLSTGMLLYLIKNAKCSKLTIRGFRSKTDYVKSQKKNKTIAYEHLSEEPTIYWLGWIPFIISYTNITFLRFTYNPETFIKNIVDCYNETLSGNTVDNRFYIRNFSGNLINNRNNKFSDNAMPSDRGEIRDSPTPGLTTSDYKFNILTNYLNPIGYDKNDIGLEKINNPLNNLALNTECLIAIEEIKRWKDSESWFKDRLIPFKRGLMLHSQPGCGKTSLIRALAMELNIPICNFDLSNMSNDDFTRNWTSIKNYTPCIALFEDFDSIFDGRKNLVHTEGGLSFDCLLNNIDGVNNGDGILLIVTTNNIDKIDVALGKPNGDNISTRPGRIDRVVEILPPDENGRRKIAHRILRDFPEYIEQIIKDGDHDTGAQFQERCSRLALKLFWENKK
jgi:hypothetical protein